MADLTKLDSLEMAEPPKKSASRRARPGKCLPGRPADDPPDVTAAHGDGAGPRSPPGANRNTPRGNHDARSPSSTGFARLSTRLLARLVTAGLIGSTLLSPTVAMSVAGAREVSAPDSMVALVDVMARRAEIGDTVAAAKWGTTQPIDDPAREKTVLDNATAKAPAYGVDPAVAVAVFSDQIAASKVVQYGLFSGWTAHPDQAPTKRPDLTTVRPILDAITDELLTQLRDTGNERTGDLCRLRLAEAQAEVADDRHFDNLHREALVRAGTSICR